MSYESVEIPDTSHWHGAKVYQRFSQEKPKQYGDGKRVIQIEATAETCKSSPSGFIYRSECPACAPDRQLRHESAYTQLGVQTPKCHRLGDVMVNVVKKEEYI